MPQLTSFLAPAEAILSPGEQIVISVCPNCCAGCYSSPVSTWPATRQSPAPERGPRGKPSGSAAAGHGSGRSATRRSRRSERKLSTGRNSDDQGTSPAPQGRRSRRSPEAGGPLPSPPGTRGDSGGRPLHRLIYEKLLAEIQGGQYSPGDRLPSEASLCERFGASRITVAKAIHTLQRDRLVLRRPGSGTYVENAPQEQAHRFGLLIPELGTTEIFEPICQGMMSTPLGRSHSLIWGHTAAVEEDRERAAEQLCRQYIDQKVSGVFFAPLEFTATRDQVNRSIIAMLRRSSIPIVLLDRCYEPYPRRSALDLIGIDNFRAGFVLTEHLLHGGAQRLLFVHRPNSAATVSQRAAGFREALFHAGNRHGQEVGDVFCGDRQRVAAMLDTHHPDALVCANDLTAATLMRTLLDLGVRIPEDVRVVGVDDVSYAKFLPVPLTTLRQNTAEIGASALWTMLDRIEHPNRPARDVLADFKLIIRESCGGRQRGATPPA